MTDHLRPSAPIAELALLPGDPRRALALAQELLDRPRMANHARGLWGYSGTTSTGLALTIQATGIGGPSLAVVVAELAELGLRRAVRLGTCRALRPDVKAGDIVVAGAALAGDGASRSLGAPDPVLPDPGLTRALRSEGDWPTVTVATTDLHHDPDERERSAGWLSRGAAVADLATAPLLALGVRLAMPVAAGLVVSATPDGRHAGDDEVDAASLRLGRAAAAALAGERAAAQASGAAPLRIRGPGPRAAPDSPRPR